MSWVAVYLIEPSEDEGMTRGGFQTAAQAWEYVAEHICDLCRRWFEGPAKAELGRDPTVADTLCGKEWAVMREEEWAEYRERRNSGHGDEEELADGWVLVHLPGDLPTIIGFETEEEAWHHLAAHYLCGECWQKLIEDPDQHPGCTACGAEWVVISLSDYRDCKSPWDAFKKAYRRVIYRRRDAGAEEAG